MFTLMAKSQTAQRISLLTQCRGFDIIF